MTDTTAVDEARGGVTDEERVVLRATACQMVDWGKGTSAMLTAVGTLALLDSLDQATARVESLQEQMRQEFVQHQQLEAVASARLTALRAEIETALRALRSVCLHGVQDGREHHRREALRALERALALAGEES